MRHATLRFASTLKRLFRRHGRLYVRIRTHSIVKLAFGCFRGVERRAIVFVEIIQNRTVSTILGILRDLIHAVEEHEHELAGRINVVVLRPISALVLEARNEAVLELVGVGEVLLTIRRINRRYVANHLVKRLALVHALKNGIETQTDFGAIYASNSRRIRHHIRAANVGILARCQLAQIQNGKVSR